MPRKINMYTLKNPISQTVFNRLSNLFYKLVLTIDDTTKIELSNDTHGEIKTRETMEKNVMSLNISIRMYSFCISQIVINLLTTCFMMLILENFGTMKIPTLKVTGIKINNKKQFKQIILVKICYSNEHIITSNN